MDAVNTVAERVKNAPTCHGAMSIEIVPSYVVPDIEPYIAVAGDRMGKPISSRREHREFLKRNKFVEVGNEPVRPIKNDFRPKRSEVREEIRKVVAEVLPRHRG